MGDEPTTHALFASNSSDSIHISAYNDDAILLPDDNESRESDNNEDTYQRAQFSCQYIAHIMK